MKRLLGTLVAVSFLFCAGIANAAFMYYLEPLAGSGYTISGNGSSATPYSISITSAGTGTINFELFAAIQSTSSGRAAWGTSGEYLSVINSTATGSGTLPGTFLTNGSPQSDYITQTVGNPGCVMANGDPVDGNPDQGGNAANLIWYGGQVVTAGNGSGSIGLAPGTQDPNSGNNWQNCITLCSGTTKATAGRALEPSANPNGAGWYDIPLGSLTYQYGSVAALAYGQTAQISVVQDYTPGTNTYYGSYYNDQHTLGIANQQANADTPTLITYNFSSGSAAFAFSPSSAIVVTGGRLMVGTSESANTWLQNVGTAAGPFTLATSGGISLTTTSSLTGSLTNGTSSQFFLSAVSSTPGVQTGTLYEAGGAAFTLSGTYVNFRPLAVTASVPSSVLSGAVYGGAVVDNVAGGLGTTPGADNSYTMPKVGGSAFLNVGGLVTISGPASQTQLNNGNPTVPLTFAYSGYGASSGSPDIASQAGIVSPEGIGDFVNNAAASHLAFSLPSVTVGLAPIGASFGTASSASLTNLAPIGPTTTLAAQTQTAGQFGVATSVQITAMPSSATGNLSLAFRLPTSAELTAHPPLCSDVAQVVGTPSQFAIEISYNPNLTPADVNAELAKGQFYMGYNNGSGWSAVTGTEHAETLSAYLGDTLGTANNWGVDETNHEIWAVVGAGVVTAGGTTDFAAVPEPTTLALLAAGLFGLVLARRYTKKSPVA